MPRGGDIFTGAGVASGAVTRPTWSTATATATAGTISPDSSTRTGRIIVNAGDFGLTAGVCRAIVELSREGIVSNTSAMMCSEGSIRNAAAHFSSLAVPCGVHLQLTDGRPASREMAAYLERRTRSAWFPDSPDRAGMPIGLVRIEWDEQVQCFLRHFGRPSHLDSHQWVHLMPDYLDVYCETAARYDVPVRGLDACAHDLIAARGVRATRHVVNLKVCLGAGPDGRSLLADAVRHAGNGGGAAAVLEILTHPGYHDGELQRLSPLAERREIELAFLREERIADLLGELGLAIVDYPSVGRAGDCDSELTRVKPG